VRLLEEHGDDALEWLAGQLDELASAQGADSAGGTLA
jgi:hypothetical protein